jgi:putative hemolysin
VWILGLVLYGAFLGGAFFMQAVASGFRALEQTRSTEELRAVRHLLLYRAFLRLFFPKQELEALFFSISCTKELVRYGLAVGAVLLVVGLALLWPATAGLVTALVFIAVASLLIALVAGDFFPRYLGLRHPFAALELCSPLGSLFLFAASPICFTLLGLMAKKGKNFSSIYVEHVHEGVGKLKEKILEMLEQAGAQAPGDTEEREMLESVVELRDTLVREIMIPRIDMFCLESETTVRKATELLDEQGYSRAPVYTDTVDQIVGVILYKDLARLYVDGVGEGTLTTLEQSIASFVKPVLFVPETSRVSRVLADFRRRQTHLAIVVDEYGGTEGLVTIEDCLEEIVGEIADEYDEAAQLYTPSRKGGWVVDARMTIADIEDHFGITIPQEGDYDTIGGYAFHRAGEIPAKGLRIHHDAFDLEILESSQRCVERVWIRPTNLPESTP